MSSALTTDPPAAAPLPLLAMRHPSEYSRLLLALCAVTVALGGYSAIVLVLAGPLALAVVSLTVVALLLSVWVGLQLHRAVLVGRSVRVTPDTLPEIQALVDDIRDQLGYHRAVEVYVAQEVTPSVSLTSYLGTKVILIEGQLIGDLIGADRAQLTFLLARTFGALKARHERLAAAVVVLEGLRLLPFVAQFVLPYFRATTYSGDQIGLVCCGSLPTALAATERLLVGKEVEPKLRTAGVIAHAQFVRRRWLPRLIQLLRLPEPHLTNRYVNLLLFWSDRDPEAFATFQAQLDDATRQRLDALARRSAHRRPPSSRGRRAIHAAIAAAVTAALIGGTAAFAMSVRDLATSGAEDAGASVVTPPAPDELAPTPAPPPVPTGSSATDELLSHIPPAVRDSCTNPEIAQPASAIASLTCEVGGATVYYNQYANASEAVAQFDAAALAAGAAAEDAADDCSSGSYAGTWSIGGTEAGRLLCWQDADTSWIEWTHDELHIEASMLRTGLDSASLYDDWLKAGPE
jgi:hypothetical protein